MKKELAVIQSQETFEKVDQETGEVVVFNSESEGVLLQIERRVTSYFVQVAIDLKRIKDERLYLLRADNFGDYCRDFLHMSRQYANQHVIIANSLNEKLLGKLSKTNLPMTALMALAKNDEIANEFEVMDIQGDKVQYEDGTSEPLKDVISRALENEKKKTRKKLTEADSVIQGKQAIVEDYKSRLEEQKDENEKLKKVIQEITHRKDIDPRTLVYITQKKEALNVLDENSVVLIRAFGAIGGIPHELIDTEVTMRLTEVIASIEAGLQRLREEYGAVVWIPGKTKSPDGFIPE